MLFVTIVIRMLKSKSTLIISNLSFSYSTSFWYCSSDIWLPNSTATSLEHWNDQGVTVCFAVHSMIYRDYTRKIAEPINHRMVQVKYFCTWTCIEYSIPIQRVSLDKEYVFYFTRNTLAGQLDFWNSFLDEILSHCPTCHAIQKNSYSHIRVMLIIKNQAFAISTLE